MTSNVRDPPFGDPVQPEKVLSAANDLLQKSGSHRNVPTSPVMHVGMSATSPPTPTNWSGGQQRPPHGVANQFDFNPQTARSRFRDPANSVPGAFPAETYANNGQASFAGGPHGAMSYTPRGGHAHRGGPRGGGPYSAQSAQERGPYKSGHVTSATYEGSATPLGNANTNANVSARGTGRGTLVKSSTVDSHMAVPCNATPAATGDGNDTAAFYNAHTGRDRQFVAGRNGNGSGNGRPNTNPNWVNTWANQNNSTAQNWQGQVQNWPPGQNSTALNWTSGTAGAPSTHANWGYGQAHGQSHRGSNRGSRTQRATFAVAAVQSNAQPAALAVGPSATAGPGATADVTDSSSPNGSTSTDGVSSACATDSAPERVSTTEPGTEAATQRRSTPPPSATSGTARRSTNSASASPTAATGSAPPPDSALGTPQQTENWQSASSSPASASGVATPTRTTNKFGLTFGEYSAEIDNIVNPNRTAPSTGVSISMNASGPLAPAPVHTHVPTQIPAPPVTDTAELARPQAPAAGTGVAAEPPAASEPRAAAPVNAKQKLDDSAPAERQSVIEAPGTSTASHAAVPPSLLTLQLIFELQRSFDDVHNKALKGSKRIHVYDHDNRCFHQHAAPTVAGSGTSITETHTDSTVASSSAVAPTNCASPALPKS